MHIPVIYRATRLALRSAYSTAAGWSLATFYNPPMNFVIDESVSSRIRWRWVRDHPKLHWTMAILISYTHCMLCCGVWLPLFSGMPRNLRIHVVPSREMRPARRAKRLPLVRHCQVWWIPFAGELVSPSVIRSSSALDIILSRIRTTDWNAALYLLGDNDTSVFWNY